MFPVTTPLWEGHGTTQEKPEGHWDTGKDEFHTVILSADYPLAQPRASYLLIQGQQRPHDPVWFIQSIREHAGLTARGLEVQSLPLSGSGKFPQCVPMVGPRLADSSAWLRPAKPATGSLWGLRHFYASNVCYSTVLDRMELPISENAASPSPRPANSSSGHSWWEALAHAPKATYVTSTEHQLLSHCTFFYLTISSLGKIKLSLRNDVNINIELDKVRIMVIGV